MNIERPTSNVEWEKMEKRKNWLRFSLGVPKSLKREKISHSRFDIGIMNVNKIAEQSDINVRCSTLAVRCSVRAKFDVKSVND
jgi:hypothetical protein